ncbi:XRE family transcriptional regulator [Aestuariibacter sp. GS-14]|uniref:helix-turn-helix domain-containing protein n=1 Tax=Aestuariibacter sp. GS-14 TaxID=2590670 RepID=UPI0011265540|nr:helix-turn-helix transcriptional regulator [Aestuariibacter sp. GS-14]TPV52895.1 XRE family transcriptional regulator [Aestuariibacter sp. GS-14]
MTIKYYDSPFHVARDEKLANKVAMKIDLSIMLSKLIKDRGWTQAQAAEVLNVNQSRISDLKNAKIEKFTIDSMIDMLESLGFKINFNMRSLEQASISIAKPDA